MAAGIAISSVLVGALVGLISRGRFAGPIRTFALVAALVVVMSELLPSAITVLGVGALVVAALAFIAPSVVSRAGPRGSGLELAYAGLLVHKVVDGLTLEVFLGGAHAGHGHLDVALALALHAVPVTALVVVTFIERGHVHALGRVVGLIAATLAGVAMAGEVPGVLERFDPYIMAAVAGLLMHVVVDEVSVKRPEGIVERVSDLVAVIVGIALVLFTGHSHHDGTHEMRELLGESFLMLALATAPALLLGLVAAAGVEIVAKNARESAPTRAFQQAITGIAVGLRRPVCACGILPEATSLERRGAPAALVGSFLIATPALGIETFALTVNFFGWTTSLLRLLGGVLVALAVGAVIGSRVGGGGDASVRPDGHFRREPAHGGPPRRWLHDFDELVLHKGPWLLVGLLIASYAMVLPDGALTAMGHYAILVVVLVATPMYICAASATPLAAVLLLKGLSPAAVLIGLILGPVLNIAIMRWLGRAYGARVAALAIAAAILVLASLGVGTIATEFAPVVRLQSYGWVSLASTIILSVVAFRGVWRHGLIPWLSSLRDVVGGGVSDAHDHEHHHHAFADH